MTALGLPTARVPGAVKSRTAASGTPDAGAAELAYTLNATRPATTVLRRLAGVTFVGPRDERAGAQNLMPVGASRGHQGPGGRNRYDREVHSPLIA